MGAPSDQFLRIEYGGPFRSVSSLIMEASLCLFFSYYMGGRPQIISLHTILEPPDHFLRLLYGAPQITFFSYNMGTLSDQFHCLLYEPPPPSDQFLCMLYGNIRQIHDLPEKLKGWERWERWDFFFFLQNIWGPPQIGFSAYYMGPPQVSFFAYYINMLFIVNIAIYCLSGSAYFSTQRVRNWLPSEWHVCGCIHLCR